MTIETKKLLKKLIKAQMAEDRQVFLNFITLTAETVHDETEDYKKVDLSEFKDCIHSILRQLEKLGYITQKKYIIVVEHPGFHILQTSFRNFMTSLMSSFLIPIIVSAITTLITVWLTLWLTPVP